MEIKNRELEGLIQNTCDLHTLKLAEKENEIKILQDHCNDKGNINENLKQNLDSLENIRKKQIEDLEIKIDEIFELNQKIYTLNEDKKNLINQKEETHSKLDELTNMLEQNKDSLKDIVADNNNKQLQIQLLELNISKLRDEQDKNKIESKDFYEGILEKKDTTLKKLEEELKSNQIEIREIQNDLIKNKELLSQKENDITTLSNSNSENLINISALQHKLDSKIIRHKEKIKSKDIHIREKEEIITLKETEINNLKKYHKELGYGTFVK